MDFREHQDRAKKNSRIIWFLYILLLTISSFLIGWTFVVGLNLAEYYQVGYEQYGFWEKFSASNSRAFSEQIQILLSFSAVTFAVQASVTAFGFFKKSDGHKVAAAFNAQLLNEDNANSLEEKQALNIVAEQALAANVPTPTLYLIPEPGINAFAAGKTSKNAVVAITQGALDGFNRAELSGVIAHEIGHIVNQDIKLNIQISAFVFGFTALFFLARFMFYNAMMNRRMDVRAKLIMFAMAAIIAIIGALTVWLGRILQAAMSRQREYLADASAVQFTRYPEGLVQAFEVLEGKDKSTKMENPSSKEYAHAMIFGIGGELFATHPPLADRIARIQNKK
ncbi:M48 family metalloprotease [Candidatus Thioglobus sp.]|uniref:M48 family metalloprotease n=1 Tax=Candidatus Thioglobus sp. TaxID=2026721 RepID=UPI003D109AE5